VEERKRVVQEFFSDYEARFNRALGPTSEEDVEATAGAFAACFVAANPTGVYCGRNDQQFRAAIPQGNQYYRNIGMKSVHISAMELTELDQQHMLAKVFWDSFYEKPDGKPVEIAFAVIYLLQINGQQPRIFAYITGDEQLALQEHGLLPY